MQRPSVMRTRRTTSRTKTTPDPEPQASQGACRITECRYQLTLECAEFPFYDSLDECVDFRAIFFADIATYYGDDGLTLYTAYIDCAADLSCDEYYYAYTECADEYDAFLSCFDET